MVKTRVWLVPPLVHPKDPEFPLGVLTVTFAVPGAEITAVVIVIFNCVRGRGTAQTPIARPEVKKKHRHRPRPGTVSMFSTQTRRSSPTSCEETKIENDFQKKCRKGAKFAAHTAFSAILGEISCLFSLALEFFTRFLGGSFQPLKHLSAPEHR